MSGPFKVGDVVVCIDDTPHPEWTAFLGARGVTYDIPPVHSVLRVSSAGARGGCPWVAFPGFPPILLPNGESVGLGTLRFRHLPKADDQFIQQMRAIKPVREGVSA